MNLDFKLVLEFIQPEHSIYAACAEPIYLVSMVKKIHEMKNQTEQ
jgi:hypothetical protein